MKKLSLILLLGLVSYLAYGQFEVPQIVIDAEGHSGTIKALRFTPDGSKLVSFSDDKTIKIWDVETGELIQTLRGPAMVGPMGMVNSGAIHPNGNVIVSGGYFGPEVSEKSQLMGRIFLWDINTGKIIKQLNGPESPVIALDISPNGKWLTCGTTDNEIGLWNLTESSPGMNLSGHTEPVYVTQFSPDSKYLVTGGYDKKLIRWDLSSFVPNKQPVYTLMTGGHTEEIRTGTFTPDGQFFISGGYDNQLIVWNQAGKIERYLDQIKDPNYPDYSSLGDIHSLAITQDGKYVIVGTILTTGKNVQILDFQTGKIVKTFDKHDNTVTAVTTFGGEWVASAGGENRDIYIWNIKTGAIKQHFASKGTRIYSVAAGKQGVIGISTIKRNTYQFNSIGQINYQFSYNSLKLTQSSGQSESYQGATKEYGGITAVRESDYILRLSNGNTIKLDPNAEGVIMAYTFTPQGNIAVAGTFRTQLFDIKGRKLLEFLGHTAMVTSLCVSQDKKFLISGSSDQTVRLWDLSEKPTIAITFEEFKQMLIKQLGSEEKLNEVIKEKNINLSNLYLDAYEPFITPFCNLFLTQNGEWILWKNDNYYASSPKGSSYVGFHINQKSDQEAKFMPFEQYDLQYNRPDKVLQALTNPDPKLINAFYRAWQKRIEKYHALADSVVNPSDVPSIELQTNSQVTDSSNIRIKFNASDFKYRLDRMNIYLNGVPIYGIQGQDLSFGNKEKSPTTLIYSMKTPILPGKNKIQVSVKNRIGIESERRTITVISKEKPTKPNLYVITIGTSIYKDKRFNLSLAAKDAQDIAKQWNNRQDLFEKVFVHSYTNEQVTKENLLKIKETLSEATTKDVVILFVAGHGILDSKLDYYFGTHDIDFNDPAKRGFSYQELDNLLDGIKPIRKLLLIDSCHSGELDKEEVTRTQNIPAEVGNIKFRSAGTVVTSKPAFGEENTGILLGQLFSDIRRGTGATVVAAAGGTEFALESNEWNNGLFTYAFLNGLTKKAADLNNDNIIMLSELKEYIQKTVFELSQGKQNPISRQENPIVDVRLW
ncbi:MAG: caspase family protein [Bacteroidia bacterium]|nr:caspase family protein [Bacteroidia bacterium]